ncbi:SprT family protein [Pediococcus argentinicus]|uniref:SprT family protein n=1 Tax=Pediococcus argentinicus TaxID=480391 RepID=UPI00338DB08C
MTDTDLQQLVERIALNSFHQPFKYKAFFNKRLKTTGGRYHLNDHHIDINPLMFTEFGMETLEGVIKHELVHYFIHMSGEKPSHQNPHFKQLLLQVGGLQYAPFNAQAHSRSRLKIEYVCQRCGQSYIRRSHIDTKRYVCSRCQGRLMLVSEERAI